VNTAATFYLQGIDAMLPTSFHNVTALMEVSIPSWRTVLDTSGEGHRFEGEQFTHGALWTSLTQQQPGSELLDALDVIHELGTDAGRAMLEQAAADQQVDLGPSDDECARELAARVWVQSRSDAMLASVLTRARANSYNQLNQRTFREYVGERSIKGTIDKDRLEQAVKAWCKEHGKSQDVHVYMYEHDGQHVCEVLRGAPVKRLIEFRDSRPGILNFRPATSDHLRYDPKSGRIGIATRSPNMAHMYREVAGTLLANDEAFFSGESICRLQPLQQHGRTLFDRSLPAAIHRVDVTELQWSRDGDKLWVKGKDCFQILIDLGAHLNEGELIEAKLVIHFAGGGRRGLVSLKVPNRIDIHAGVHERLVERLLDDVGIRGSFDSEAPLRDFWSLYPWRLTEDAWRRQIGDSFDDLVVDKTLSQVWLSTATHPNHPAARGALAVVQVAEHSTVGISDDPAIGLRTLTPSDYVGYELDVLALAKKVALSLQLDGKAHETSTGVWSLGTRALTSSVTVAVFLVTREPSSDTSRLIQSSYKSTRPVLLIPHDCLCEIDLPMVPVRLLTGSLEGLIRQVVVQLDLQDQLPPPVWAAEDLIIDNKRGIAWYKKHELSELKHGTHAFSFALSVTRAQGRPVSKNELCESLSPKRPDNDSAKEAKSAFITAVKKSFEKASLPPPAEVNDIFVSRSGGYALKSSAIVID
jgi:hypothetical protein